MKAKAKMKFYSLDEVMNKHLGRIGTPKRDAFEAKLLLDVLQKNDKKVNYHLNLPYQ